MAHIDMDCDYSIVVTCDVDPSVPAAALPRQARYCRGSQKFKQYAAEARKNLATWTAVDFQKHHHDELYPRLLAAQHNAALVVTRALRLFSAPRIMRRMAKEKREREAVKRYEAAVLDRRGQIQHAIKYEKQVEEFIEERSWMSRRTSYPSTKPPHLLRLSHLKRSLKSRQLHFQLFPELYPADGLKLVYDTIRDLSNAMVPADTQSRDLITIRHTWSQLNPAWRDAEVPGCPGLFQHILDSLPPPPSLPTGGTFLKNALHQSRLNVWGTQSEEQRAIDSIGKHRLWIRNTPLPDVFPPPPGYSSPSTRRVKVRTFSPMEAPPRPDHLPSPLPAIFTGSYRAPAPVPRAPVTKYIMGPPPAPDLIDDENTYQQSHLIPSIWIAVPRKEPPPPIVRTPAPSKTGRKRKSADKQLTLSLELLQGRR